MKHQSANITVEGEGHNPYAVAAESKEAFVKRMEKDGHYQTDAGGVGYTTEERAELSARVWAKATEYVAKHPHRRHKHGEEAADASKLTQPANTVSTDLDGAPQGDEQSTAKASTAKAK